MRCLLPYEMKLFSRRPSFFLKGQNIFHPAVERIAERVQRFGADGLPFFHAVQRVGRKALLENQVILRYSLLVERFIKGLIADHFHHPFNCNILNLLIRLNILSIIKARNLSGGKKNGKNCIRTSGQANQGTEIHG